MPAGGQCRRVPYGQHDLENRQKKWPSGQQAPGSCRNTLGVSAPQFLLQILLGPPSFLTETQGVVGD